MGDKTGIQWTDHTFNPWLGCQKVSDGCKNCYAEVDAPARKHRSGGLELWGPPSTAARVRTSESYWKQPFTWDRKAASEGTRHRVFCASQADVFEDNAAVVAWREQLFSVIERTPHLDWQLLTKRPENFKRMLPASWLATPRANVWLGTTVENQAAANARIPKLLATPAAVRFLSCEPLLEAVDLNPLRCDQCNTDEHIQRGTNGEQPWCIECDVEASVGHWLGCNDWQLDWVIVGGESGAKARPFDITWAREIVKECSEGTAVFVKQLGAKPVDGSILEILGPDLTVHYRRPPDDDLVAEAKQRPGYMVRPTQLHLVDSHGGDMAEWPADLRVRELPERGDGAR